MITASRSRLIGLAVVILVSKIAIGDEITVGRAENEGTDIFTEADVVDD